VKLGLKGKRALVMAASRGLGFACAMGLAREGCDLLICSRDQTRIEEAAEQIRQSTGVQVYAAVCDTSQEEAVKNLVASAVEQLGGLEIVVHNSGGPPAGGFASVTVDQWYQAFNQNLMSFVWVAQAAIPAMRDSGYGRILTIASSSIKEPIPNLVLSNATRTGVLGVAKTLAREVAPDGILVNVVAPGRIATERTQQLDEAAAKRSGRTLDEVRNESVGAIPLGRLGEPQEFANLVVFLASEAASYITGTAILVDGGKSDAL
jgi:3-oxoacyl-[acyl-carrier protein] reductase